MKARRLCTCFLSAYAYAVFAFTDIATSIFSIGWLTQPRASPSSPATDLEHRPLAAGIFANLAAVAGLSTGSAVASADAPARDAASSPLPVAGDAALNSGDTHRGAPTSDEERASPAKRKDAVATTRAEHQGIVHAKEVTANLKGVAAVGQAQGLVKDGDPSRIRPLIWLHYPKCGSTFEVTLVHHACGSRIPEDFVLLDPLNKLPSKVKKPTKCVYNGQQVKEGWANYSTCKWNSLCGGRMFDRFSGGHDPLWLHPSIASKWSYPMKLTKLGDFWPHPLLGKPFGLIPRVTDNALRRVVAMFREPRQRVISHYHHALSLGHHVTPEWAFEMYSACMTQLTLGCACGRLGDNRKPFLFGLPEEKVRASVAWRVRQFGFVGLTQEWALSVCVFHTLYGGDCLPAEFRRLRPGVARNSSNDYDIAKYGIGAEYKPLDDDLYRVATEVFWIRIVEHGITKQRCKNVCPKAAERFD